MKVNLASKVYNLLWITPTYPMESVPFVQPIPSETIENILHIGEQNASAQVRLWVDSRRLTKLQMGWLDKLLYGCVSGNIHSVDLQTVPAYARNPFYALPDKSDWRFNHHSLIWRQVDAAKLLICLQGNYDQTFYSDADITNVRIDSEEIQQRMSRHGIIVSGGTLTQSAWYENQFFGFCPPRRPFLKLLYELTLMEVVRIGENGYGAFIDMMNRELRGREGIDMREVVFGVRYNGTVAQHPGHTTALEQHQVGKKCTSY